MSKFIVSIDMIIAAKSAEDAIANGKAIAEKLHREEEVAYYVLADQVKPVLLPEN